MSNKEMKAFFDERADSWDSHEKMTQDQLKELLSTLPIKEGMKVIDLACGTGIITDILYNATKRKVLGIDLSTKMINVARNKISKDHAEFVAGDFLTSNITGYDFIVLFNAYPHFLETDKLIDALGKCLNPKGKFAILHSLGREQLHHTHSGSVSVLSRDLLPVVQEAERFEAKFKILEAREGKNYYYILGEKR